MRLTNMTINYEKIKCPYCGKKFLATYRTSNFCPKCQAQTSIGEIGWPFKCKSCSHKFRSPKTYLDLKKLDIKCPKCGSRKIKSRPTFDKKLYLGYYKGN
ncbi:MAG: hypothetical protein ACFFDH_14665 [Promethearchaeota archaeon]